VVSGCNKNAIESIQLENFRQGIIQNEKSQKETYQKDKTDITDISYEPWHYRYVGKEAVQEIYDKGLCLEEYAIFLSESPKYAGRRW
jgi:hypothetical protein